MKQSRLPLFAALCALVLIGCLFFSFFSTARVMRQGSSGIVLPDSEDGESTVETPSTSQTSSQENQVAVAVTTENVQRMIATMERVGAYSADCMLTYYWDGEQESAQQRRRVYVRDGAVKIEQVNNQGQATRHLLLKDGKYYSWRTGETSYYQAAQGGWTADLLQGVPRYEMVLELAADAILSAQQSEWNGEPVIQVEAQLAENRTGRFYLSTASGLLIRYEQWEGGDLVMAAQLSGIQQEEPAAEHFLLPS